MTVDSAIGARLNTGDTFTMQLGRRHANWPVRTAHYVAGPLKPN